ncbi:hypothetical protein TRFO_07602 [Tritrichomonas foetus]|uniref:Uncharacterized protein n=1 Tax=Tritrichomonas foetus TaxID=1144522 RepID=A0A1J4JRI9_9EUKA|nr:hypothetical protein TRFO_07602 [Tritrichomonas foetus]|eukprot:OHT01362.1 hypothetical protein TRFO_07602 [Tritrichomonas foetus]
MIVSHILYKETEWKLRQVVGAVVLTVGAALYSLPKLLKKRGEFQSPQQIEQQADTIDVLEIHEEDDEEENMKIDFSSEEKNDSFHFDNTK